MNAARQQELEASLQRELNVRTEERKLDSAGRVAWLVDQVENYVQRWLGMSAVSPTRAPVDDELFRMIEIGAGVVSAELQGLQSFDIADSWRAFLAELASVRVQAAAQPDELKKKLAAVRSAVTAATTRPS